MVATGHTVLPVIDGQQQPRLLGMISQFDLLKAHERLLIEERHRERPLRPLQATPGLGRLRPVREPAR